MNEPPPTKILILGCPAETARRWTRALEAAGVEIRCQATPDYRPELIVTDLADIPASEAGDPGVVRVGTDGPGDVRLPADCTDRELCLACRLLAQIVRLRRRAIQSAEIHRELSAQAMTDPLTGLPNRRAWDAALPERLALAGRRSQLCLAILDLDHFKQINDSHGHAIGDEVLRATGVAINDNLRQDDFVARLGGDEFGLLLWVPDEEVAAAVVERSPRRAAGGFLAHGVAQRHGQRRLSTDGDVRCGQLPCPLPTPFTWPPTRLCARPSVGTELHRGAWRR